MNVGRRIRWTCEDAMEAEQYKYTNDRRRETSEFQVEHLGDGWSKTRNRILAIVKFGTFGIIE